MAKPPPPRQTSPKVSSLASRVLSGTVKPTIAQSRILAASAMQAARTEKQLLRQQKRSALGNSWGARSHPSQAVNAKC